MTHMSGGNGGSHDQFEWTPAAAFLSVDHTSRASSAVAHLGQAQPPLRPTEPGQCFDVPYAVVIDRPNLSCIVMVWWSPFFDWRDGSMTPMWHCFIPGPGGMILTYKSRPARNDR